MVSSPNHLFFLGKLDEVVNQYLVPILLLVTDNNPSWMSGRKENGRKKLFHDRSPGKYGTRPGSSLASVSTVTKQRVTCMTQVHLSKLMVISKLCFRSTVSSNQYQLRPFVKKKKNNARFGLFNSPLQQALVKIGRGLDKIEGKKSEDYKKAWKITQHAELIDVTR